MLQAPAAICQHSMSLLSFRQHVICSMILQTSLTTLGYLTYHMHNSLAASTTSWSLTKVFPERTTASSTTFFDWTQCPIHSRPKSADLSLNFFSWIVFTNSLSSASWIYSLENTMRQKRPQTPFTGPVSIKLWVVSF